MAKLRDGPGKVCCQLQTPLYRDRERDQHTDDLGCSAATSTPNAEAETDVRGSIDAASTTDLEYGASGNDY